MTTLTLRADDLDVELSTRGGLVTRLAWTLDGASVPLLREAPEGADALASACYPLVPFGNRVRDNRFRFDGRTHELTPNTDWDPHYVHGEGWQTDWTVLDETPASAALGFSHPGGNGTPYVYDARQDVAIRDGALHMRLSVTNRGEAPMPFGLGWHPYFPMTPGTTLRAEARRFWTEVEGWMPGEPAPIPGDLDFSQARPLPERWVNNGFEDWSGTADIRWPERGAGVTLEADPVFRHAFVFVSDRDFDPSYRRDYFCFEPMTHLADGHNMADLGGLRVLRSGESLSGGMTLRPRRL